ncbi:MAG: ATP-binding protein [Treponema sp.]|nr:ATP-binding protein [Treponema sp.]
MRRKLPIGIQDFKDIRDSGYVYVDKTAYIYKMVSEGKPYFLARPRRFGKSLFASTLKYYFEGRKELFEGIAGQSSLAIASLEKDWTVYPVLHFDLTGHSYMERSDLKSRLGANLRLYEEQWGRDAEEDTPSDRFSGLIRRTYTATGQRVVVIIDEYDKPLVDTLEKPALHAEMHEQLQGFYSVLKATDQWLRFVFITGVTKFSKVSIFSTLNQLSDISLDDNYSGICGISETELLANFEPELRRLGEKQGLSYDETVAEMHKRYNGYHFSKNSEGVFNPFSTLKTFFDSDFSYYWSQSGIPTFLVAILKKTGADLRKLSGGIIINRQAIDDYRPENADITPLLYQTGYLTIKGYEHRYDRFILGFPNEEVKYSFLTELLLQYAPHIQSEQGFFVTNFIDDLEAGNVDAFMNRLKAFFANLPYDIPDRISDMEQYYQSLMYVVFTMMGEYTQAEVRSSQGRADLVVTARGQDVPDTVFVFEFKLDGNGTADDALKQIDEKGYLTPYSASGKKLVKIGAVFDKDTLTLGEWKALAQAP